MTLILLLDGRADPESLEVLADLMSYYVGSSGGALLHCVIRRSGPKLIPFLEERLESERNDCHANLGASSRYCLTDEHYRSILDSMIYSIQEDESCYIEK